MPQEPVQIPHPESPEGAEPDIAVDDGRLKTGDTVQIGVDPDVLQSIHKELEIWKDQMMDVSNVTMDGLGLLVVMVFNATFNNISVISWQSVFLEEETRVSRENHRHVASHLQTLSHNVVSSKPCHEMGSNSQRTDFIGSCKFNYHSYNHHDDGPVLLVFIGE